MKKVIITIAVSALMSGTILTSCNSSEKKVEDARENVVVAKQELNQALKDSIQEFRTQSEIRIEDYEKTIVELKANIAKEKKENRSEYEKDLAKLEQKNADLKMQLADFKEENQEKWYTFKTEFNNDMDELGLAFKNFVKKDKK
jgi:ribosomal protein L30E